jgi:hypothetical protein
MVRSCSTHEGEDCYNFSRKPDGKWPLGWPQCRWEDSTRLDVVLCTGFIWLRIETSGELLRRRWWTFSSILFWEIQLAEEVKHMFWFWDQLRLLFKTLRLSWANLIQFITSPHTSVIPVFNIILSSKAMSSLWSLPFRFPHQNLPTHFSSTHISNTVRWTACIMELLITNYPHPPVTSSLLYPKYSSRLPDLEHSPSAFALM